VVGVQPGEPASAAHQDGVAAAAGHKQLYLGGGRGVVQDQQQPCAGGLRTPEGGTFVKVVGHFSIGDADRAKQPAEGVGRGERGTAGGVAVQVEEERAVRVRRVKAVGEVDDDCGLADPGDAVDGGETWRIAGL